MLHLWNELKLPRREHKFFMAQFFKPVSYTNLNQINHVAPPGRNPNVRETVFWAKSGNFDKNCF